MYDSEEQAKAKATDQIKQQTINIPGKFKSQLMVETQKNLIHTIFYISPLCSVNSDLKLAFFSLLICIVIDH